MMKSISESNLQDTILEVKNFSISYRTPHYQNSTLRGMFINAFSSPIDFILKDDDRFLILDNISFTLKKGERLGILGNNGSGKSSLCRYIAGIFGSYKNIKINGQVKAIFDTEAVILPELSGLENLELLTEFLYSELSTEEKKEIVQLASVFSELKSYLDVPFKLYSKGMRARLFLSLITARPTDLLILDEVFNGADYFFNEKISARTKEIIFKSESAIFVSHSQELMAEVCNRILVLDKKKIVFDGSPVEAIKYYRENCRRININ